ncbi:hypothetical protein LI328DRAFT_167022 [Trichoderma asperelloides]|nr:hypothetical protein LI328DRAFT_167022 [Trichoderma asperelloides]
MRRRSKQKSCFACVASKRGCDKVLPTCSRCEERELTCEYPPNSQSCSEFTDANLLPHASSLPIFPSRLALSTDLSSTSRLLPLSDRLEWFIVPPAWTVAYHYEPPSRYPPSEVLSNFTRGIQSWLKRFLHQGHNPFIHRHLYSNTNMPPCIQDAFSSISIHQNETASNEHIIDDIFASHVSDLVTKQPIEGSEAFLLLSTRDHLARTQALLIHLLLALFSSSIPRRAKAECLIATLHHWTNQLWQSASQDADFHTVVQSIPPRNGVASISIDDPLPDLYQSFVLYESTRRTWILSNFAAGVYQSLSLHGLSLLKDNVAAEEVDEFMRHLYTIMWGIDKVEDWIVRSGDTVSTKY